MMQSKGEVRVTASPRVCQHDVHARLKVSGLRPFATVTLYLHLLDDKRRLFESHAWYTSDSDGNVDVDKASSEGGSYTGMFPAGLLTMLKPGPHEDRYIRLVRVDPTLPWEIKLNVYLGHLPAVTNNSSSIASTLMVRHIMAPGVQRLPVKHDRLKATLFLPPGPGPFPGIIDIFGGRGGLVEHRAAMTASKGMASLAVAFFNYEGLPNSDNLIDLDYFEEAVNYLLTQPKIIPDRCGVMANCLGGIIGLLMGIYMTKVKAVAAINTPATPISQKFIYKGEVVLHPAITDIEQFKKLITIDEQGHVHLLQDTIDKFFTANHPNGIPIYKAPNDTKFFIVGCSGDSQGSDVGARAMKTRMDNYNKTNFIMKIYLGAGHLLEPPFGALAEHSYQMYTLDSIKERAVMFWGGEGKPHCNGQENAWIDTLNFLRNEIHHCSDWYQNHLQMYGVNIHSRL